MPLNVPHYTKLGGRQALGGALTDWQPIGRAIEPAEIGQSVAFLLSDASRAITGTSFVIDAACSPRPDAPLGVLAPASQAGGQ